MKCVMRGIFSIYGYVLKFNATESEAIFMIYRFDRTEFLLPYFAEGLLLPTLNSMQHFTPERF
jgi:hypothetical protein